MTHESFFTILLALALGSILYPSLLPTLVGLLLVAIHIENTRGFHALYRTPAPFV